MYKRYFKRGLDVLAAGLGLVLLAPLFALLALLVRWKLGAPVLFRQRRPGLHGKPFVLVKFRTMTDARDTNGDLLPNQERMTRFGMFLRSTSLDELPELWNVIKGDMSLVGPRPLLMEYIPYYDQQMLRRHEVLPGLTGWVQVNGRNALGWEAKFELDTWYVDHVSFRLDMFILLRTLKKVVKRDGIAHEGDVAMPRFDVYMLRRQMLREQSRRNRG